MGFHKIYIPQPRLLQVADFLSESSLLQPERTGLSVSPPARGDPQTKKKTKTKECDSIIQSFSHNFVSYNIDVLGVRLIIHCIAPPGLRFLPLLYFERFPATKIQAQEPCRAELRSDARDANNTPDHLKEAKFNSVNLCFGPFSAVCAILGSPRGPKWFNLVEILEFGQNF